MFCPTCRGLDGFTPCRAVHMRSDLSSQFSLLNVCLSGLLSFSLKTPTREGNYEYTHVCASRFSVVWACSSNYDGIFEFCDCMRGFHVTRHLSAVKDQTSWKRNPHHNWIETSNAWLMALFCRVGIFHCCFFVRLLITTCLVGILHFSWGVPGELKLIIIVLIAWL